MASQADHVNGALQCIVLAIRPLLFCFLKIRFESPGKCQETLDSSRSVRNLMQTCMDSAQQIVGILHSLQAQGLLGETRASAHASGLTLTSHLHVETFLPFDLDSAFASTVVLLMGPAIEPRRLEPHTAWIDKAHSVFEEMIEGGNLIARLLLSELQKLDEMLCCISGGRAAPRSLQQQGPAVVAPRTPMTSSMSTTTTATRRLSDAIPPAPDYVIEDEYAATGLTAADIMALADSIESYDTEWMSNAISEHRIW